MRRRARASLRALLPTHHPRKEKPLNNVVVSLEAYRQQKAEPTRVVTPAELRAMPYNGVCDWAGTHFNRLVAAAEARDCRPEWIGRQIEKLGGRLSEREAKIIADMVAKAGPFLNRRRRWIMRHRKSGATMGELDLIKLASSAEPYRNCHQIDRCVRNDLANLRKLSLIQNGAAGTNAAAQRRSRSISSASIRRAPQYQTSFVRL